MKTLFRKHPRLTIFYLFLLTILLFFRRPVEIVNPISNVPAEYIKIIISPLRILIEPFLGPIFYYARSHDLITEHLVFLLWILTIFLFFTLITFWRRQVQLGRYFRPGAFILRKLALIPIFVFGIIALLAFEMFVPLPTNTVQLTNPEKILVNFHSHSVHSYDGLLTYEELIKWHQRNGFQVLFLTEHNQLESAAAFAREREKANPDSPAMVVLPGEEYSGGTHLLLLDIDSTYSPGQISDEQLIQKVHTDSGLVFIAHWWQRHQASIEDYIRWGVDGFEIVKQDKKIDFDRQIFTELVRNCRENQRFMLGTTDYHGIGSTCYTWTALRVPGWPGMNYQQKQKAILSILKNRQIQLAEVLIYDDRPFLSPSWLVFSPIVHLVNYFRSLYYWQFFSWIIWSLLLTILLRQNFINQIKDFSSKNELAIWSVPGFLFTILFLWVGFTFTKKAEIFSNPNSLLLTLGSIGKWLGLVSGIYSTFLLGINLKRRVSFNRKIQQT